MKAIGVSCLPTCVFQDTHAELTELTRSTYLSYEHLAWRFSLRGQDLFLGCDLALGHLVIEANQEIVRRRRTHWVHR